MTGGKTTIRLKLTLLYGGLFVIAGLLLIIVTYGLVRRELRIQAAPRPIVELIQNRTEDGEPDEESEEPEQGDFRVRQEERTRALRELWRQALIALAVATTGSLGLGWVVAGRVLDPLRKITSHAQRASASTLGDRIASTGPDDELKELADTFDAMLDRLQAAFFAQQAFAAQASHELRTPLTIIRAEAEVATANAQVSEEERGAFDAILRAVVRSELLVDALLTLARSESTMLDLAPLDLADLAGDVVGEQVVEAANAQVRLDLNLESVVIQGDRMLLDRMIGNLLQNAIRYNRVGGTVSVSVRQIDGAAAISVANTGPPMDQDEVDRLFEPFVRGEWARRQRSGFGLGLAIVQSVAHAHRGSVAARSGPDGGLAIEVRLSR